MSSPSLALAISGLINITYTLSPVAAQGQNLNSMMLLGSTQLTIGSTTVDIIDTVERYRQYTGAAQLLADGFSSTSPEYLSAVVWFAQWPNSVLLVGKWSKNACPGALRGGAVPAANLATLQAITTGVGSLKVTINGTLYTLSTLNFTGVTSFTGVAGVIQTALQALLSGTICLYNSSFQRFEITAPTTGVTSAVSFLQATGSGTDVSALIGGQSGNGGYLVPGQAAESAITAVNLFDNNYGQNWYGLYVIGVTYSDIQAIASYIEGATNKHTYWYTANANNNALDAGATISATTTDIVSVLGGVYQKTWIQYSSTNQYAALAAAAKYFQVNYGGNNTVIDLMYKQEPTVLPEQLSATQAATLKTKNYNVFVQYNNNTAIIQWGRNVSGTPMDTIIGLDNLLVDLMVAWYNQLYLQPTKLPQTDSGVHVLVTVAEQILFGFVQNGFLAPGIWNQPGFGQINQGDYLNKGYYVYPNPIVSQTVAARATRSTPLIQIGVKLAGAIEIIVSVVNVNQ